MIINEIIIVDIFIALSAIPIHELGHYFSSKFMGLKTILNMKNCQTVVYPKTDLQFFIILISGIILGFIPIIFITDPILKYPMIFTYLIGACLSDNIYIIEIICKYLNLNVPDWIQKTKRMLIPKLHHKFCVCSNCHEIKHEYMFFFRG